MKICYIHGFNSAFDSQSKKVICLSTIAEVIGVNYDSFNTYDHIYAQLEDQVKSDACLFAGTSLGGYWAVEMARRFSAAAIIINPCRDPSAELRKHIGISNTNYVTGKRSVLSEAATQSYPHGITSEALEILPLVLLDMGDPVLDSNKTKQALSDWPMVCWPGGSHRFEHITEAMDSINQYINRVMDK